MRDMPYFMKEKKWFEFDFKKRIYVLTKEAPEKAKESYKKFYDALNTKKGVKP